MDISKGYEKKQDGVLHQLNSVPIQYDNAYVGQAAFSHKSTANLRVGYILEHIPASELISVLDFGSGQGHFVKNMNSVIPTSAYDLANLPELEDFYIQNPYQYNFSLVTFFDSLEHCYDIGWVISNIKARYICISVPWCHSYSEYWMTKWRHFKPNEHLWYFTEKSLLTFMDRMGYNCLYRGNIEDCLRKPQYIDLPNILTGIFHKR